MPTFPGTPTETVANAGRTFEGFGVSHASILTGTGPVAEEAFGDIYGVRSATIAADQGNSDNSGDDFVLSTWFWINFATVTVEAGYIPFDMVALLQSDVVTATAASGGGSCYAVPLWSRCSQNTRPRPLLVKVPGKDTDGNLRDIWFVLYKVFWGPINFTGPAYKSGLLANYAGKAVLSNKDEAGTALVGADRSIGRLVSCPSSCA